jgi:hypothetical protein
MKELSDILFLMAQAGEAGTMTAAEICEIEEELISALQLGFDDDEVEMKALYETMLASSTDVEDDSTHRKTISLKVARQYMDELQIIQENRPALERHLQQNDAMIKDLAAMHISSYLVQTTMLAFCSRPAARSDFDGGSAWLILPSSCPPPTIVT